MLTNRDEGDAVMRESRSRDREKAEWGPGPWSDEPDEVRWVDAETGFPCVILRNRLGGLCGYVGVPSSHPFHGVNYGSCPTQCGRRRCGHSPESRLEVHGGLTYSGAYPESGHAMRELWWFGFDCTHPGDLAPSMVEYGASSECTYRDRAYVEAEVKRLARQLTDVREPPGSPDGPEDPRPLVQQRASPP